MRGQARQISNSQLQSKSFKKTIFSEFAMRLILAILLLVTVVSVNGGRSYNTESSLIENVLNIDTEKIVTNTTSEFQTQGWWSRWWRSQWWWQKWWFWRFWRQKQQWEKQQQQQVGLLVTVIDHGDHCCDANARPSRSSSTWSGSSRSTSRWTSTFSSPPSSLSPS